MKNYVDAAIKIFGSGEVAEMWFDDNSDKLTMDAKTVEEAEIEITNLLNTSDEF